MVLRNILIGGLFILALLVGYAIIKASGEQVVTQSSGGGSTTVASAGLFGGLGKLIPDNLKFSFV